jgi:hypothetical protein
MIHGGLASDPEAVECRKNGTNSIICLTCDAIDARRVGEWLSVCEGHR